MDKITLSNIGTYHEIEYLKKTLGPVLISALAEVCMKRPTDPIEYLGHWLLRWRYNEELKRRDMENSIQVIRQRQTGKCEQEINMECPLPLDIYGQGVTPLFPFLPPGYGGPVTEEDLADVQPKEEIEEEEVEDAEDMEEMNDEEYVYPRADEMIGEGGYDYDLLQYDYIPDPDQMIDGSNEISYDNNSDYIEQSDAPPESGPENSDYQDNQEPPQLAGN